MRTCKERRQRVTDIDVQHSTVKKQISLVAEQHDLRSSDGSIEAAKDMFCIASEYSCASSWTPQSINRLLAE